MVELRFFGGLSEEETAEALNVSPRTVRREWMTDERRGLDYVEKRHDLDAGRVASVTTAHLFPFGIEDQALAEIK